MIRVNSYTSQQLYESKTVMRDKPLVECLESYSLTAAARNSYLQMYGECRDDQILLLLEAWSTYGELFWREGVTSRLYARQSLLTAAQPWRYLISLSALHCSSPGGHSDRPPLLQGSVFIVADIHVESPRKMFIFIIKKRCFPENSITQSDTQVIPKWYPKKSWLKCLRKKTQLQRGT